MAGTLAFAASEVRRLIDHVRAAPEHMPYYGHKTGPALMLVGDMGIYLMSNGTPADMLDPKADATKLGKRFVAYGSVDGESTDPEKNKEGYYDLKRAVFGGDDGVELLDSRFIDAIDTMLKDGVEEIHIRLSARGLSLLNQAPRKKAKS